MRLIEAEKSRGMMSLTEPERTRGSFDVSPRMAFFDASKSVGQAVARHPALTDPVGWSYRYQLLLRRWEDSPKKRAILMGNLAGCLQNLGKPNAALEVYRLARSSSGSHSSLAATLLSNEALCLSSLGRIVEAREKLEQSSATLRGTSKADDPASAESLINLGSVTMQFGQYAQALDQFRQARGLLSAKQPSDDFTLAICLNNEATCLQSLGRQDEALVRFRDASDLLARMRGDAGERDVRQIDGMRAMTSMNLGNLLLRTGKRDEALARLEEARTIDDRLYPDPHPARAVALNNLALCLNAMGRKREALEHFRSAARMYQGAYRGDHPATAVALRNIGMTLAELGERGEARTYLEQALVMAQRMNRPDAYQWFTSFGDFLLHYAGDAPGAARMYEEAIAGVERARVAVGGDDVDRAMFFAGLIEAWDVFRGMAAAQLALGRPDLALEYLERGRARGLLDVLERGYRLQGGDLLGALTALAAKRGDEGRVAELRRIGEAEREARGKIAEIEATLRTLRDWAGAGDTDRIRTQEAALRQVQDRYQDVRRHLFNVAGDFVSVDLKPRQVADFQALLDPAGRQRMLVYSVGERCSSLYVVSPPGQSVVHHELKWKDGSAVTESSLGKKVQRYRASILWEGRKRGAVPGPDDPSRGIRVFPADAPPDQLSRELSDALIPGPLWQELKAANCVYLVPDASLYLLPFEALVVDETSRRVGPRANAPDGGDAEVAAKRVYWLDDGPPIAYGPSATVLVNRSVTKDRQLRARDQGQRQPYEVVAVGDPVFDRRSKEPPSPPESGLLVDRVEPNGAAQQAGMKRGDVIVRYDGHPVSDRDQFRVLRDQIVARIEDGERAPDPLKLQIWRAGREETLLVRPGPWAMDVAKDPLPVAWAKFRNGERLATVTRGGSLATRSLALTPLPGTRRELLQIYRTIIGRPLAIGNALTSVVPPPGGAGAHPVVILLGEDATLAQLSRFAGGARFLHLATHGIIYEQSQLALNSSLALTQPAIPTSDDTGFLDLAELLDNWWGRLGGTELVVLSACDTLVGILQSGEGLLGLPWGFMYAGSPAVVASLWEVDDEATAELMGNLYASITRAGGDPAHGLSTKLEALVKMKKVLRQKKPEPYYWSAFVYLGDPR